MFMAEFQNRETELKKSANRRNGQKVANYWGGLRRGRIAAQHWILLMRLNVKDEYESESWGSMEDSDLCYSLSKIIRAHGLKCIKGILI